ncbi:MAG TPA: hypothetical protein PKD86_11570 [Gemmatales bacterium]|nr:hypothetical protein [Gemmatales bacterium]HMP59982.1 hypothetical protein [Gemmatales bacterium]
MHERLGGRVRNLEVLWGPAGIILKGQTSSYYFKQLAQQAVLTGVGLPLQANDIRVYTKPPAN